MSSAVRGSTPRKSMALSGTKPAGGTNFGSGGGGAGRNFPVVVADGRGAVDDDPLPGAGVAAISTGTGGIAACVGVATAGLFSLADAATVSAAATPWVEA